MGYDISVRFSSTQERDEMLAVLKQQDWAFLHQTDKRVERVLPQAGENLGAYIPDDETTLLGFHASLPPSYTRDVCVWAAVHSSYRENGYPVVYYDDEALKIVVGRPPLEGEEKFIQASLNGIRKTKPTSFFEKLLNGSIDLNGRKKWFDNLEQNWAQFKSPLFSNSLPSGAKHPNFKI